MTPAFLLVSGEGLMADCATVVEYMRNDRHDKRGRQKNSRTRLGLFLRTRSLRN